MGAVVAVLLAVPGVLERLIVIAQAQAKFGGRDVTVAVDEQETEDGLGDDVEDAVEDSLAAVSVRDYFTRKVGI